MQSFVHMHMHDDCYQPASTTLSITVNIIFWYTYRDSQLSDIDNEVANLFPCVRSRPHSMGRSTRQELALYNRRRGYSRQRQPLPPMRAASEVFTRDVVLIEKNEGAAIPRGAWKSSMHDKGHITNMVDFDISWSEHKVREKIKSCLPVIDRSKLYPRYTVK